MFVFVFRYFFFCFRCLTTFMLMILMFVIVVFLIIICLGGLSSGSLFDLLQRGCKKGVYLCWFLF